MNIVYKYPLRIAPTHAEKLRVWSCGCRYLWNRTLRLKKGLYERYKVSIGFYGPTGTNKRLTTLRNRYEWLFEVPNCVQQKILMNLDVAFKNFFRRIKQGQTPGYPRFKNRSILPGLYFPKQRFSIVIDDQDRHYLKLTKMPQLIRIDVDRPYLNHPDDSIQSCSIVYERRYWYICLLVETQDPVIVKRNLPSVGINRGVKHTVSLSNGEGYQIDNDRLKYYENRKAHLQKQLSGKIGSKKGQKKSGRWIDLKNRINTIDTKMADIRCNFNHVTSRKLVDNYGQIVFENFDIKQMTKSAKGTVESPGKNVALKSMFNREILRAGWGQLMQFTEYKAGWVGNQVLKVAPENISRECFECGNIAKENVKLHSRIFKCTACNHVDDIDKNAAKNVLKRAAEINNNSPAGSPG